MFKRSIRVDARAAKKSDSGDLVISIAFASEEPHKRWWGVEILDHASSSVRLDRLNDGASLLFNHNPNDLRGVHVPGSVGIDKDRVLRGDVRITAATQAGRDTIALVESGVLTKASIGYRIFKVIQQTTKKDGTKRSREIDGALFQRMIQAHDDDLSSFQRALDDAIPPLEGGAMFERSADDEADVYRIVDWEPYENSLVTIPADVTVGVGRSAAHTPAEIATPKEARMAEGASVIENNPATAAAQAALGRGATQEQIVAYENRRISGIDSLVRVNNIDQAQRDLWVTSGTQLDGVADDLVKILEVRGKSAPQRARLGLSAREAESFSIRKAIYGCAMQNWKDAGLEAECSRELANKLGRHVENNRFLVPYEIQERAHALDRGDTEYSLNKRDLTVASGSGGGFLVATQNMGFVELLRNRSVLFNMGARRLAGLKDNITIPKQTGAASVTWLANESSTVGEGNQTFAQIAMTPKTVGGYTEISRQLLIQSSPEVEGLVMLDLATVVALAIDLAGLNGSGASGQPTGILQTSGIGSVTGTSLDYADIIEFQSDVFAGNALVDASGYVTTGAVAGLLKQRVKFSSTASPLWDGRLEKANVDGYQGMASNQMPTATMLFGDFGQVIVGEWGVLEIETNQAANFQAGIIGVRALASVDIAVRYATAFSAASSIT